MPEIIDVIDASDLTGADLDEFDGEDGVNSSDENVIATVKAVAATIAAAAAASPAPHAFTGSVSRMGTDISRYLHFDIETIPDRDREHLFNLPPVQEPRPMLPLDKCPSAAELVGGGVDEIEKWLLSANPCPEFVAQLADCESKNKKSRKGVFDAIKKLTAQREAESSAKDDRIKLLSVTPAYCKICALGWAVGGEEPASMVLSQTQHDFTCPAVPITERMILEKFWELAERYGPLVGFNHANFDLPVIFMRSGIIGVGPTRVIDTSPYGKDCLDLMTKMFGRGKAIDMKTLCDLCGIAVKEPGVDGSMVNAMMERGDLDAVGRYVRSDVWAERDLFHFGSGYFWH